MRHSIIITPRGYGGCGVFTDISRARVVASDATANHAPEGYTFAAMRLPRRVSRRLARHFGAWALNGSWRDVREALGHSAGRADNFAF